MQTLQVCLDMSRKYPILGASYVSPVFANMCTMLQNVIQQQQNRVSTLETEIKSKDTEHSTLRTKLEQLQVRPQTLQSFLPQVTAYIAASCTFLSRLS